MTVVVINNISRFLQLPTFYYVTSWVSSVKTCFSNSFGKNILPLGLCFSLLVISISLNSKQK